MPLFQTTVSLLIFLSIAALGIAIGISLVSFLRMATRYLELKIQEIEHEAGH